MPTNAVKAARDEHLWNRAKEQAKKQGHAKDYAYIMGIFRRMKGEKSMVALLAGGEDVLRKGVTVEEAVERKQLAKRAKRHRRQADDHRRAKPSGGNTMGRWRQQQAHDDAQEAHREAAEANEEAITDASKRNAAEDASDAANTHSPADEVKSMEPTRKSLDVIAEMEALVKAAQPGEIIGRTADGKEVYGLEDKLQKPPAKKSKKSVPPGQAAAATQKPPAKKIDPEEEENDGEGSHDHHADRALAHLQAAQAHASAAHSAKKVEEAKEHKGTVANARKMSEAAMSDPKKGLEKSLLTTRDLRKAMYPRSDVIGWAGQFYGTPLHVQALEHLKQIRVLDKEEAEFEATSKPWREVDDMPRQAREEYRRKRDQARKPLEKRRGELEAAQCTLEGRLIDHHLNQARAMNKSVLQKSEVLPSPEAFRACLNKSIVTMVQASRSPQIARKNNLLIDMGAEDTVVNALEKGGACIGRQAAGIQEDGRNRLLGMRQERMEKATIYQGEWDAHGSRGGDLREPVARAQCSQEMVEMDPAGNRGQGGLNSWFADAWSQLSDEAKMQTRQGMRGPLATGWQKGMGSDESLTIIDDSNPYSKAVYHGQPGEHQSAVRLAYQGNGRENLK